MKNIFKTIRILTLGIVLALSYSIQIHAQSFFGNSTIPCITRYCTLEAVLNAAFSLIRPLFIVTFVGLFLYGSWVYMTSKGDSDKIATARRIFVSAVIGFSLAVLAPSISTIILSFLGVNGIGAL